MQVEFTLHASVRMAERGISQAEVLATLAQPALVIPADNGCHEARGFIQRSNGKMLLRVIYSGTLVISVNTVIATSQFKRYGV